MTATLDVVDHWTGPGRSDAVITTPPLSENGAHPQSRRGAFEHWYFDARLDSGHTIVGFLQTAELITKRPGVELHVYYPDGRRREIRRPYKRALVSAAEDRFDVRVGENWGVWNRATARCRLTASTSPRMTSRSTCCSRARCRRGSPVRGAPATATTRSSRGWSGLRGRA